MPRTRIISRSKPLQPPRAVETSFYHDSQQLSSASLARPPSIYTTVETAGACKDFQLPSKNGLKHISFTKPTDNGLQDSQWRDSHYLTQSFDVKAQQGTQTGENTNYLKNSHDTTNVDQHQMFAGECDDEPSKSNAKSRRRRKKGVEDSLHANSAALSVPSVTDKIKNVDTCRLKNDAQQNRNIEGWTGESAVEDDTNLSHYNNRDHVKTTTLSKGRGGRVESVKTETHGRSKTFRRHEHNEDTMIDNDTESEKPHHRKTQVLRSRRDIRDYGIGVYFARVLRETQNSNCGARKRAMNKSNVIQETEQNKGYEPHMLDSKKSTADCIRMSSNKISTFPTIGASKEVCDWGNYSQTSSPCSDKALDPHSPTTLDLSEVISEFGDVSVSSSPDALSLSSQDLTRETGGSLAVAAYPKLYSETVSPRSKQPEFDTECVEAINKIDTGTVTDIASSSPKPPPKRKKRRRTRRLASSSLTLKVDSASDKQNSDPSSSSSFIPPTDADSGVDLSSQSSIHSSVSCPAFDQVTDSRSSSAERLRICSSPSFTYDPEIASQIPFYFKEPAVDECEVIPGFSESGFCFDVCDDSNDDIGDDGANADNSSNCSWSEFDGDYMDDLDNGESELAYESSACDVIIPETGTTCHIESGLSDSVLSDGATNTSSEDASDDLEIDYDNYLPGPVLMHVKRDLVSVLMEYGQTREVKVSFKDMERSGPHHASRFHTAAIVNGETFPVGSGSSKKNAKKAAAAQALKIMYDRGRKNLEVVNEVAHRKLKAMTDEEVGSHAHRVVLVSRHVLDTAEETQFINYSKDKIAATFVLEYHGKMRVVGLGTGNRCILYQHMTFDGKRVIHSHAEIIARRAFLRYLYKQLLTYNGNRSHPIFTRSDTGKLKLRDKIQVHLYISRPPCGDAAAFPTISNFPNKMRAIRKQGQLRTIIDDGEGAIPTDFPVPAGANGKERLRIMTCSDKICRWNVLGVQGAMLSHFIDPIYLTSLVIGSHTGDQRGHVPRAVSGRLKCGRLHEVIQRPYRINTPDIHYPHDDLADNYNITKSKQYCITWSYGDIDAEVIDAITGVTNMEPMEEVVPSRVSKITLYNLFLQVCKRYGRQDLSNIEYLKAKRSATTFQRMKNFVGQHLAAMGFGQWYSLQDTYGTDSLTCPGPC